MRLVIAFSDSIDAFGGFGSDAKTIERAVGSTQSDGHRLSEIAHLLTLGH